MAMGIGEGGSHVGGDDRCSRRWQRTCLLDRRRQRLAIDVLHHDEVGPGVLAPVEDRHKVRVAEASCRLRFALEALDEGGVDAQLREEHLESDDPIEQSIVSPIDLRHATARDQMRQLVAIREDARLGNRFH